MIRLAAAAMLNETPDAKLRWADVDAVIFVAQLVSEPLNGLPRKTRRQVLYLLLADPVKRLDKERDGILLIEQHGPAFLASSRLWLIASFEADSREGSKS